MLMNNENKQPVNRAKVRIEKNIGLIMSLILFLIVIALTFFRQHDIRRWEFVFHLTVWSISFFIQGFLLEKKPQKGTMVIHVDNAIKEMKNLNAGELEIAATHIRGAKTYKTTTIISLEETDETEDDNDEDSN
jgi:hypothetical protein